MKNSAAFCESTVTPAAVTGPVTLKSPATTRASFGVYNDRADVDALVEALAAAESFFAI